MLFPPPVNMRARETPKPQKNVCIAWNWVRHVDWSSRPHHTAPRDSRSVERDCRAGGVLASTRESFSSQEVQAYKWQVNGAGEVAQRLGALAF